jgi:predicted permease
VPALAVLMAMGSLVLLIVCANIAGLVMARGLSRHGEIAARLALGATRRRIVWILLVENLVLIVPATLFGIVVARQVMKLFVPALQSLAAPQRLFFNFDLDWATLVFTAAIAGLCTLVFGVMPSLQTSRVDLVSIVNEDLAQRGTTRGRLLAGLVTAQIAVSLVLLVGAGLVMRAAQVEARVHPGFVDGQVMTIDLNVDPHAYTASAGRTFYRNVLSELRADPLFESSTIAAVDPLAFFDLSVATLSVEGYSPAPGEALTAGVNTIGSEYFSTLRMPFLAGRPLDDRDDAAAPAAAVVNRTLADRFFGGPAMAVGRRIRVDSDWRTIVGVSADAKYVRLSESPRPYVYVPFSQSYRGGMIAYVRSDGSDSVVAARCVRMSLHSIPSWLEPRSGRFRTRGGSR